MGSFWSRKVSWKGGVSPPPASHRADLGMHIKENSPKPWMEDAVSQQPVVGDPGKKFDKFYRRLWGKGQLKGGSKQQQASQGAEKRWRTTGMQEQAASKCAKPEGKVPGSLVGPKTCKKATQDGDAQREDQADLVTAVNIRSMGPCLREDGWGEPINGCKAWHRDLPSGCGEHRDDMVHACASKDEKGRTTGSHHGLTQGLWVKDAATIPQGDWQDFNTQSAEGRSGEEQRRQVWEKLQLLGEDMVRWQGRSTKDLSVRLAEVILQIKTKDYPMVMGRESDPQQQRGGRVRVSGSEEVGALVDTHTVATTMQQDLAVDHDITTFSGFMYKNNQHIPTIPEPSGEDSDLLQQGDVSDVPVRAYIMVVKKEEPWREEFPGVWAQYEMDCGLVSEEVEVDVDVRQLDYQPQPILPVAMENKVASLLKVLLRDGVVVEGHLPHNIPLVPEYKSDGKTLRLKLDCRAVKATRKVVEPVSLNPAKLISTLSPKSKYFSVVDLSNASFAIPLAAGSRTIFAFTFRNRQYLFTRLPQGFHSTTSITHRRVAQMLSQLDQGDSPWLFSYVDDILITGQTQKETEARTRKVLKLIQKTGFKAKFEKAQLVQPKVVYLGMRVGPEGREISDRMLQTIRGAPCPQNVSDVRSLLGQFVFLQDHIPNYWQLARPLHQLTLKQTRWEWGPEQERALKCLKDAIETAPALRFPDVSQPFIIKLTTSEEVVAAALLQENEEGRLVPVKYSSHILKGHEVFYKAEEKGCLAAILAMQKFETLMGSAPILIQMAHSPWRYLLWGDALGSSGTNLHSAQWTLLLVNGGEVAKRPQPEREGSLSPLVPSAPPLSQLPFYIPKANVWFTASEKGCSVGFAAANLEERWLLGVAECDSVLGAEVVALWQLLCHHRCSSPLYLYTGCQSLVERLESQKDWWEGGPGESSGKGLWPSILQWVHTNPGMLHVRCMGVDASKDTKEMEWNQKVVRRSRAMSLRATGSELFWEPSKHEKQEIIAQCHSWLHEEVEETLTRVRQVVSWEGDHGQVTYWVQNCLQCAASSRVKSQRAEGPWSQLHLGYISGLTESKEGYRSLLVVEDVFSGWVEAFPIQKKIVEEMVEVLSREIFARYGTPSVIRLPRVPPFLRNVAMMAMSGMESPWHILQVGQVTPATSTLQRLARGAGKKWVKMLPVILAGIRSVWVQGEALGSYQVIGGFPLEMRWGQEAEDSPQGNVLSWLSQLQEDGVGYKQQIEAVLPRGCLGEETAWP